MEMLHVCKYKQQQKQISLMYIYEDFPYFMLVSTTFLIDWLVDRLVFTCGLFKLYFVLFCFNIKFKCTKQEFT